MPEKRNRQPRPKLPRIGFRVVEVAEMLGESRATTYRRVKDGMIRRNELGLITPEELRRLGLNPPDQT
jgi:predicted DNA-binding transcriptional regulator AlpA